MGLDVYLYKFDDYATTTKLEKEYEQASDANWKQLTDGRKYDDLSDAEKEQARSANLAVAERLGLGQWGEDETRKHKIELDSAKHPEHMFKVGYFRSSYNEGGINYVLRAHLGLDLADIMGNEDDQYEFQPDWFASRARAVEALDGLKRRRTERPYRATSFDADRLFTGVNRTIDSEQAALDAWMEELKRNSGFESYSSSLGHFFRNEPMRVRAAIPGVHFGRPCVWAVYEDSDENMRWYEQALEIVIETCDYVLAQGDAQKFWLHWSG